MDLILKVMSKRGDIEIEKLIGWGIVFLFLVLLVVGEFMFSKKGIGAVSFIKQITGMG